MKTFPGFYRPLPPGFINGIKIPSFFVEHHLPGIGSALLRRGGKGRTVKITGGVITGDGWIRFADDNGLEVGDIVKMDLVKDLIFEVSVFDKTTACGKQTKKEEEDVIDHFATSMEDFNITHYYLNMPKSFTLTNGLSEKRKMILTDKGGRIKADVKLSKAMNRGRYQYRINYGGPDGCPSVFSDGGIKKGDAFKLELVENGAVPVLRFIRL